LKEIGAEKVPSLLVLNKIDRCDAQLRAGLRSLFPEAIPVSALNQEGFPDVVEAIARMTSGPVTQPVA